MITGHQFGLKKDQSEFEKGVLYKVVGIINYRKGKKWKDKKKNKKNSKKLEYQGFLSSLLAVAIFKIRNDFQIYWI